MKLNHFLVFALVWCVCFSNYVPTLPQCPNRYGNCYVFHPEDEWNRPIDNDPVDFMSDCYVAEQMAGHNVHLDMGSTQEFYGIPYQFTSSIDQLSTISYGASCGVPDYSDESDPGPFHIPANAHIEGGSSSEPDPTSGDRHVLAFNLDTCMLFETFNTIRQGGGFCCSSSALFNMSAKNFVRPDGYTSADAAGMAIFPALIKYDEAHNNSIKHALRFTLPSAPRSYVYPGNHYGPNENMNYPPYGTRFRLKSSFDISIYTGEAYSIVYALKKYGMFFTDQGSSMYITGTSHPNFDDAISQINSQNPIDGSMFEAVQTPANFEIKYGWSVTPVCNLRYANDDPGWLPQTRDYSECRIEFVPDNYFWRDFGIVVAIVFSGFVVCVLVVAVVSVIIFVSIKLSKRKSHK